jgi:hypothetical protein
MGTIAHCLNLIIPILWWVLAIAGGRAFWKTRALPCAAISVGSLVLAALGTLNAIFPPGASLDSEGRVLRVVEPLVPGLLSLNASLLGLVLVIGGVLVLLAKVGGRDGP